MLVFTEKAVSKYKEFKSNPKKFSSSFQILSQIVKIGQVLQSLHKEQNYVGEDVHFYFTSESWHQYNSLIIKPESARFNGYLADIAPPVRRLTRKVTLGETLIDDINILIDSTDQCCPLNTQKCDIVAEEEKNVEISPHYLDNKVFPTDLSHDIEDLLREVNNPGLGH